MTEMRQKITAFLTPSQKYEIWLQLLRQESTVAEVAAAQQVEGQHRQAQGAGHRQHVGLDAAVAARIRDELRDLVVALERSETTGLRACTREDRTSEEGNAA